MRRSSAASLQVTASQRLDPELPEAVGETARSQDVGRESASGQPLEHVGRSERRAPVDLERASAFLVDHEGELVSPEVTWQLCDSDPNGSDRPYVGRTAASDDPVGRIDEAGESTLEASDRLTRTSFVNRLARPDVHALVARDVARRRPDDVPLPRRREARDPAFEPAKRPRVAEVVAQGTCGSIKP